LVKVILSKGDETECLDVLCQILDQLLDDCRYDFIVLLERIINFIVNTSQVCMQIIYRYVTRAQ
jgi:hypothetical protein